MGLLLTDTFASAGWVSMTNESKRTLVILEVFENSLPKRGKSIRLLPGETYREYHPFAGEKRFHILEHRGSGTPLFLGLLRWPKGDVGLRISSEAGVVTVTPTTPCIGREPAVISVSAISSKP